MVDEVTFVLKLLENNWAEPHLSAGIDQHKPGTDGINFIDVILAEKVGDKLELGEPREITITRYWDEIEL